MHVIRFLHQRGISVPRDVSVIGFDDVPFSSFMVPSLSTMRQPQQEMIGAGIGTLIGLIAGSAGAPPGGLLKAELVQRESTQRVP